MSHQLCVVKWSRLQVQLAAKCWGSAWSWGKVSFSSDITAIISLWNPIGRSERIYDLWNILKVPQDKNTSYPMTTCSRWNINCASQTALLKLTGAKTFCRLTGYACLSHFPLDFYNSLDRKLTIAPPGGDAVTNTRIFFVSIVLNLILIRQGRSQLNRKNTLTM